MTFPGRWQWSWLLLTALLPAQSAPRHVVFTWQGDTGTTLTVNFQTFGPKPLPARVYCDRVARHGAIADYARTVEGRTLQIAGLPERWIHRVELTDLEPGGTVFLVAGDPALGISREYQVRTIAHERRPLRFLACGDMGPSAATRGMMRQMAATSPDFVLVGGDIAYDDGRVENIGRWDTWLTYATEELVTPDGRAIPLALAIGNHEANGGFARTPKDAPTYFGLFAQDERSYFARQFGPDLVVLLLDSGHVAEHGGEQAAWLEQTLAAHKDVRHKAAIYHVPLYPSHRELVEWPGGQGRLFWAPLFDRYDLTVAFENHDHSWKRSELLRAHRVDHDGVLYLGDGCCGRLPRRVDYGGRWYLRRQGSVMHFWQVDLSEQGLVYRAVAAQGRVFDVYPEDAPGAAEAAAVLAGMTMAFQLPAGSVAVAPMSIDGESWQRGSTTVRVANPFAEPILVRIEPVTVPEGGTLVAASAPTLAPGAVAEIQVELQVKASIAAAAVKWRLAVVAATLGTGASTPIRSDRDVTTVLAPAAATTGR